MSDTKLTREEAEQELHDIMTTKNENLVQMRELLAQTPTGITCPTDELLLNAASKALKVIESQDHILEMYAHDLQLMIEEITRLSKLMIEQSLVSQTFAKLLVEKGVFSLEELDQTYKTRLTEFNAARKPLTQE